MSKEPSSARTPRTYDLIVLGAGPAGLGAAYRAAGNGREVVVVERSESVGGLAGSFEFAGVRVDYGSHRLHPATDPHIKSELDGLLGTDLQERTRNGRIFLEGRWIGFPLRATDLVRHLPPSFTAAAARDAALSWGRRRAPETFAGVLQRGLGPTICNRFYFPYARKLWGLDPEHIHAEQARRRVRGNGAGKLLRKLAGGPSRQGIFYYPRRGFGQLWEELAEAGVKRGVDMHLGTTATSIVCAEGSLGVRLKSGEVIRAENVWSTVPMGLLARMADPSPPPEVLAAASALRTRAMVLVYLALPRKQWTPFDAHYIPDDEIAVSRISEPKNYRDGDDPSDLTVLCAEIPCSVGSQIWREGVPEATARVLDALGRMGLDAPAPVDAYVHRVPSAYPIYDLGYEAAFETVAGWIDGIGGLLSFGRHGSFVHNNSHHALHMGWEAADALGVSGKFDVQAWNRALSLFDSHVVED